MRKITIYIGSFKPPHKGHLSLVKKMLKMTLPEKKTDSPGYIYIFISKKERNPCNITGEISKEIWKTYIETLPIKDQSRVKIRLSHLPSPSQTAYGFLNKIAKKGDTFYLIKSIKDTSNTRYESFDSKKGITIKKLILPGYKNLNASDMRQALFNNNKTKFNTYLPKLDSQKKKEIWDKLKILC